MNKRVNKRKGAWRKVLFALTFFGSLKMSCMAGDIYTSPYVSFSPDHRAWTTNAWDTAIEHYEYGTTVQIGNGIHMRQAGKGQHTYSYSRSGTIPVGEWRVEWPHAACSHYSYTEASAHWHNLPRGRETCGTPYFSGWIGYCADCGGEIAHMFVYMSMEAAKTIHSYETGTGMDYYYLCPWCANLEIGVEISPHKCVGISNNMYRIRYLANTTDACTGNMQDSYHLYNNVSVYEGKNVSCSEALTKNEFEREGYLFAGWNTEADGKGQSFADGESIYNLTSADYRRDPAAGTITLYAQWISIEDLILTEKLSVSEGENVFWDAENQVYYVRSDGITPFQISFGALLDMDPPIRNRIRYGILECTEQGTLSRITVSCEDEGEGLAGSAERIPAQRQIGDGNILSAAGSIEAWRSDELRRLDFIDSYVITAENSGKKTEIVPRAGVRFGTNVFYSKEERDRSNGIVIVADGEPPGVFGTEIFDGLELIDRDDGTIIGDFYAEDAVSGVKSFHMQIINTDNGLREIFTPGEDGHIRVDLSKEEFLFTGDFEIEITATDNVGNEFVYRISTTEFALHASVERILPPHEPVFEAGESGILMISTWGYADRVEVEFPAELLAKNPELNRVYDYTGNREYRKDEALQFMVPLYVEDGSGYEIVVRAYKGNRKIEDRPRIRMIDVSGTVTDHFRTRLR